MAVALAHPMTMRAKRESEMFEQANSVSRSALSVAAAFFRISTDCWLTDDSGGGVGRVSSGNGGSGRGRGGEGGRRKEGVLGGKARKMMLSFTRKSLPHLQDLT